MRPKAAGSGERIWRLSLWVQCGRRPQVLASKYEDYRCRVNAAEGRTQWRARALQQRVPRSFLLYPRKTTIFLLVSTNQTRNGILYYDMEAIWKRAQHNWKCHIEKILPPEFFCLTFPSMKRDWLHGFKDRLIAQKGPPRRTLKWVAKCQGFRSG